MVAKNCDTRWAERDQATADLFRDLACHPPGSPEWIRLRNAIVEMYVAFVWSIVHRFCDVDEYRPRIDDVGQDCLVALIGCVGRYDASRGSKFSTYAWKVVRYEIINRTHRKNHSPRRFRGEAVDRFPTPAAEAETRETESQVAAAIDRLKPRPAEVVRRYFGLGRDRESLRSIARSLGGHWTTAHRQLQDAVCRLRMNGEVSPC